MKKAKSKIFVIISAVVVLSGCGIKSNPVPSISMVDYRPLVGNIMATPQEDGVLLSWELNDKKGAIRNIYIERSQPGAAGNECPGCPQTFERIGQTRIERLLLPREQLKKMSFADKNVEKGKTYNYRLILCDEADVCQDKPAAQITFN